MPDKGKAMRHSWRELRQLCWRFLRLDLAARFQGNLAGAAWTVIAPLLQLAVFFLVFVHIFGQRVPGLTGTGVVAFLALGFWPWFAFSEAVARATTALPDHAALISKVALPRMALVLARVLAPFVLHGIGFAVIIGLMPLFGVSLHWEGLGLALLLWLPLLALALGLGLVAAAVQVFVRDVGQVIGHLLQLTFFLTPILYARELVPDWLRPALDANPLTGIVSGMRAALLGGDWPGTALLVSLAAAVLVLVAGVWLFRRCDPWFEDYL